MPQRLVFEVSLIINYHFIFSRMLLRRRLTSISCIKYKLKTWFWAHLMHRKITLNSLFQLYNWFQMNTWFVLARQSSYIRKSMRENQKGNITFLRHQVPSSCKSRFLNRLLDYFKEILWKHEFALISRFWRKCITWNYAYNQQRI